MKKQTRRQRQAADKRFEQLLKEAERQLSKASEQLRQASNKVNG